MRARADERIAKIEERLGEESAGFLSEVEDLRQELERFFRENSDGLRSRTLPRGRIGLRAITRLEIARPKTTLHRLAQRGLGDCIRIRQEIDRQALRRLDSDALRSVGVKRVTRETFYAVPKAKK
jgi:phage host-nuclease inhibitor protein Gam